MKIEAGTVLQFEAGEYSDKQTSGPFRVLKAFDQLEVSILCAREWHAVHKGSYGCPDYDDLIAWLSKNQFIEDIEHVQWYLGGFGLEPFIDGETVAHGKLEDLAKER